MFPGMRTSLRRRILASLALVTALTGGALAADVTTAADSTAAAPYAKKIEDVRGNAGMKAPSVPIRVASLNAYYPLGLTKYVAQLRLLNSYKPQIILLQETQNHWRSVKTWARKHGYNGYFPSTTDKWKNESVVLWRNNGRFHALSRVLRKAAPAVKRPNGRTVPTRYHATVRLKDRVSGQTLSVTSVHTHPETFLWPPKTVRPTWGTQTLAGFRTQMKSIKKLFKATPASDVSLIGGDFNAPNSHEAKWAGFQTKTFGNLLRSNHKALREVGTVRDRFGKPVAIDYLYTNRNARVGFARQQVIDTYSDHHALIFDLRLDIR